MYTNIFVKRFIPSPECSCGHKNENIKHFGRKKCEKNTLTDGLKFIVAYYTNIVGHVCRHMADRRISAVV